MSILRKILYYGVSSVFRLLLVLVPLFFALTLVFSNPSNVQGALKESGVYDQFVDIVLDSSAKETTDAEAKQLLNDSAIRDIARESFSPAILERSSNDFVSGIYEWLEGKTSEPQFTIDLSSIKTTLSDKLSVYAENRAAGLPTCTVAQLQTIDLEGNILDLPCLPPGVTATQVGDLFSSRLLSDADFLDEPIITNQTIADQNGGKIITDGLQDVPEAYQFAQTIKWVLLGALIATGLLLILARRDRRAGVRHVAWALVTVAAFLAIALLAYWYVFDKVSQDKVGGDEIQAMVLDGATFILSDINRIISWFVATYAALGIGALLFLRFRPAAPEPKLVTNPDAVLPKPIHPEEKPKKQL